MLHEPPVIPFSACPEHIRELLGPAVGAARLASSERRTATTKDGRLACLCGDHTNCTCKAVTRDAPAPTRPTISNAAAITAVLAMKHLDSRLSVLEQRLASGGQGQSDIDQRFAEAERKRVEMAKEAHISKIEKMAELREHTKENDALGMNKPAEPHDQPQPKDDRVLAFDPSSGDNAQATERHPMGYPPRRKTTDAFVPVPTRAQYNLMRLQIEAAENRAFRERELAANRAWIAEIEASNKERGWN